MGYRVNRTWTLYYLITIRHIDFVVGEKDFIADLRVRIERVGQVLTDTQLFFVHGLVVEDEWVSEFNLRLEAVMDVWLHDHAFPLMAGAPTNDHRKQQAKALRRTLIADPTNSAVEE